MTEKPEPECWCEYVDIGVGMQRVAEHPECPRHVEEMPSHTGRTYAEMAELVTAATQFTFLPDLAGLIGVEAADYAVHISKGEYGHWWLTCGI